MALSPVAIRVNPNDSSQYYVLSGNGRIDNFGGAPPVTGWQGWYDRQDLPVAVDLHIIDWDEPAGYIFDFQGGFIPFGGAPVITTTVDGATVNLNGLPYVDYRRYGRWSWDPSGSGQGYVVDAWGEILAFGGAPAPPRTGRRWPYPAVRAFAMNWTGTKRALTLDYSGGLHADFASAATPGAPYWPAMDVAWDIAITEWSATPKGYTLDHNGRVWAWGGAAPAYGHPYTPTYPARLLAVLSPSDPLRLLELWAGGEQFQWTASTAPTVTVLSPTGTVTDTTRPTLAWAYSDPQSDSQKAHEWLVFTEAFAASHTMTDPSVHAASAVASGSGIDRAVRTAAMPSHLPDGGYRAYVRAQDTSDLWSAWAVGTWTQDVPVPDAPTGLTAVADQAARTVALSVAATVDADLLVFEFSDDPDAATSPDTVTWWPVHGADALTLAASNTATDYLPPYGPPRTYRARKYSTDPSVTSAPSNTAAATITARVHTLHALDDPTIGGRIKVDGHNPPEWVRPVVAGVHYGLGAKYPTVRRDGSGPKAARATLQLLSLDAATWNTIEALGEADSTLVYRDPFGGVRYCELVGDWPQRQVRAAATHAEDTPLRHMHTTSLPLVEVAPPHLVA